MEDQIGDLTTFLKGTQARVDGQHDTVRKTLEANTVGLHDLSVWKPKVQADVEKLQTDIRELSNKLEHLSLKHEEL
jgi:Tfp pilus assembly PilM family ATPase